MGACAGLAIVACLHGCRASPPAYTTDQDDAAVYADVAGTARRALNAPGRLYVHPYLAVATDDAGLPQTELSTFEYEPSAALELLQREDSTVVLCRVDAQGMCAENYIVFSQIARLGERDAVVVVRSIRGSDLRALLVRLRYRRGDWVVTGSELST